MHVINRLSSKSKEFTINNRHHLFGFESKTKRFSYKIILACTFFEFEICYFYI